jgi:hypothetical protein
VRSCLSRRCCDIVSRCLVSLSCVLSSCLSLPSRPIAVSLPCTCRRAATPRTLLHHNKHRLSHFRVRRDAQIVATCALTRLAPQFRMQQKVPKCAKSPPSHPRGEYDCSLPQCTMRAPRAPPSSPVKSRRRPIARARAAPQYCTHTHSPSHAGVGTGREARQRGLVLVGDVAESRVCIESSQPHPRAAAYCGSGAT